MTGRVQVLLHCSGCGAPMDSKRFEDLPTFADNVQTIIDELRDVPERCDICTKRLAKRPHLVLVN